MYKTYVIVLERVNYLENQMDAVGNAFVNICRVLEKVDDDTHCCASEENAQLYCDGKIVAGLLGVNISNGKGMCDLEHNSNDEKKFCRPDGEFLNI